MCVSSKHFIGFIVVEHLKVTESTLTRAPEVRSVYSLLRGVNTVPACFKQFPHTHVDCIMSIVIYSVL